MTELEEGSGTEESDAELLEKAQNAETLGNERRYIIFFIQKIRTWRFVILIADIKCLLM